MPLSSPPSDPLPAARPPTRRREPSPHRLSAVPPRYFPTGIPTHGDAPRPSRPQTGLLHFPPGPSPPKLTPAPPQTRTPTPPRRTRNPRPQRPGETSSHSGRAHQPRPPTRENPSGVPRHDHLFPPGTFPTRRRKSRDPRPGPPSPAGPPGPLRPAGPAPGSPPPPLLRLLHPQPT